MEEHAKSFYLYEALGWTVHLRSIAHHNVLPLERRASGTSVDAGVRNSKLQLHLRARHMLFRASRYNMHMSWPLDEYMLLLILRSAEDNQPGVRATKLQR
jgi:hypothetical protein